MKLDRLWSWFWSFAGSFSMRIKIMGIVLILILIFGLTITFQIRSSLTITLTDQLEMQGVAITKDMAARSTDLILTGNTFDLYQLLKNTVQNNEAVRYVFILDSSGNVLSHSFSNGFPVGLVAANLIETDASFHLEPLDSNEGLIWDIAVPVLGGRVGTARVGMSTLSIVETVNATTRQSLISIVPISIIGLLAAYWLTSVLTKPISELVEVTKAITKGNLIRKAPVWASDEIGKLGMAFNAMTEYLAESNNESATFQAELVRRNLELATLNAIADELRGSQELVDMMQRSLSKVLGFMNLKVGWVSKVTEDGKKSVCICQEGLSREITQKIARLNLSNCACETAVRKKSIVVINITDTMCPVLSHELDKGQQLLCHAIVPLISKLRVFGLLHVASSELNWFVERDLTLLSAIGYQMGVAIENITLWEELKRREEVRGELLEGTIAAQEAERRRIARELHDQTGQSLTSIMIGLKVLEADSPKEIQGKVANLRQLTSQTLEEVHNLALELRPSSLDDLGLKTALEQYTKEYTDNFGVYTEFQTIGFDSIQLPQETNIAIYRIVQEALTNVAKHAKAKKVSVLLEVRGKSVVAIVEDDGKGFDVQKVLASEKTDRKLGLYGMQERTALIGGILTIESQRDKGTTIFVEVPLPESEVK